MFCSEAHRKKNVEATITEVLTDDGATTGNEAVITTAVENSAENKTSSGDIHPFNLDVSGNPYIMTPPPIESPQYRLHYRYSCQI